ncbi:MAG: hypothetical protein PF518_18750 [Spirochaetaceae bacterium]|jgi:hypothetical protein|nr:hypothetical protein [Spirochaetaceae bacterium]
MIIQAWLSIDKKELSQVKTNIIYFSLPGSEDICGQVVKVHEESNPGIFRCDIKIYKEKINKVLKAMNKERIDLENRN